MRDLELLAPAKNKDIGIAAIDCGADAVYIAGPAFGARQAAGNSMEDIRQLCDYAHKFGARIYLTLNTILFDDELDEAYALMCDAEDAGCEELVVSHLELHSVYLHEVYEEHAADEADGSEYPDRREVLHSVKPVFLET